MEKILIIGGTAHARLYVESLLFSEYELFICGEVLSDKSNEIADEYMIHFVTFEELTSSFIRSIDLIIIATQPEKNLKIIELLLVKLNYNNTNTALTNIKLGRNNVISTKEKSFIYFSIWILHSATLYSE